MADQAVFAFTNFITNILFARWLLPVDYGMFAVSFAGYLLLTVWHFGAILEPLLVQSTHVAADRQRSFIVALILAHLILIAGISSMACVGNIVAHVLGSPQTGLAIIGACIGGSLMVTLLTARRLCLVFLSTRLSATIGVIYMAGVVGTTYLLHHYSHVFWFDLWMIMGGWSLLCSMVIFALLYASLHGSGGYTLVEFTKFQWQYARFGMIAATCSWFRVDGVMLMLARFAGLEAIAETRAVLNIANPIIQVNLALYTTWLVDFSRNHTLNRLRNTAILYCVAAILVCLVVYAVANPLVEWVYSGRYSGGAWMLPVYCLAVMLNGVESVFTCFLKALRELWRGYAPQVTGSVVSIGLGLLLIPILGEGGAVFAVVVSFATGSLLAFSLVHSRAA